MIMPAPPRRPARRRSLRRRSGDPGAFLRQAERRLRSARPGRRRGDHFVRHARPRPRRPGPGAGAGGARARRARRAACRATRGSSSAASMPTVRHLVVRPAQPRLARLSGNQRTEVQTAYRLYRTQVEAWQQARALTAFTARLGGRSRDGRRALYRGFARIRRRDAARAAAPPPRSRSGRARPRLPPLARLLRAGAGGRARRGRRPRLRNGCARCARTCSCAAPPCSRSPWAPSRAAPISGCSRSTISGRARRGPRRRPGRPRRPQFRRAARRGPRADAGYCGDAEPDLRRGPNGQLAFRCVQRLDRRRSRHARAARRAASTRLATMRRARARRSIRRASPRSTMR